jgi:hypothetical protein
MLCKIWSFHSCDYEECRLLGYKHPVRTSQETHYVSATEPSRLMLCKIWGCTCCTWLNTWYWGQLTPVAGPSLFWWVHLKPITITEHYVMCSECTSKMAWGIQEDDKITRNKQSLEVLWDWCTAKRVCLWVTTNESISSYVGFEIFTIVVMKVAFCDIALYRQIFDPEDRVYNPSETSVHIRTTLHYIPEDGKFATPFCLTVDFLHQSL